MINRKPTYIVAQDVKSGYNNVVIKDLVKTFKKHSEIYHSRERNEYIKQQNQENH